jgi:hypothetical protein
LIMQILWMKTFVPQAISLIMDAIKRNISEIIISENAIRV